MRRIGWKCLAVFAWVWAAALPAWGLDPATVGVVLLHGKWGKPETMRPVADPLVAAGCAVETPAMPWAGSRAYDADYAAAVAEVKAAADRLRAQGRSRIVVAGQSMGANMALHYATVDGSLAGVVLMAPGHLPDLPKLAERFADSLAAARAMQASGHGGDVGEFLDVNTGRTKMMRMPADTYVSYFAPDGPAAMTLAAPQVKVAHVLWVAPSEDPGTESFARAIVPKLPSSAGLERADVTSDHMNTPKHAAAPILAWLRALP